MAKRMAWICFTLQSCKCNFKADIKCQIYNDFSWNQRQPATWGYHQQQQQQQPQQPQQQQRTQQQQPPTTTTTTTTTTNNNHNNHHNHNNHNNHNNNNNNNNHNMRFMIWYQYATQKSNWTEHRLLWLFRDLWRFDIFGLNNIQETQTLQLFLQHSFIYGIHGYKQRYVAASVARVKTKGVLIVVDLQQKLNIRFLDGGFLWKSSHVLWDCRKPSDLCKQNTFCSTKNMGTAWPSFFHIMSILLLLQVQSRSSSSTINRFIACSERNKNTRNAWKSMQA